MPSAAVPIRLPCTTVPVERPPMMIPFPPFPEMTFRAPGTVPPIVVLSSVGEDPVDSVAEHGGSGGVRADVVPLDNVSGKRARSCPVDRDPIVAVSGDDVALAGGRPADHVAGAGAEDPDPPAAVPEGGRSGGVRPDAVPLDDVFVLVRGDRDSVEAVGRDHVADDRVRPLSTDTPWCTKMPSFLFGRARVPVTSVPM